MNAKIPMSKFSEFIRNFQDNELLQYSFGIGHWDLI